MRNTTKDVALGGMLSAVAVVIMCLGGIVPLATFICSTLAMRIGQITLRKCGKKIGWCWYAAVTILSLLLSADKEAAFTFAFLGYYPIIKPPFDRYRFGWLLKIAYFNISVFMMYFLLLQLFGVADLAREYAELGRLGIVVMLILGNVTFFMIDRLLGIYARRK